LPFFKNKIKICFSLFFVLVFVFLFSSQVFAAVRVQVTADILNVRSGPGTNYDKIAQLVKGDLSLWVKTEDDWVQVTLPGGETGWLNMPYVKVLAEDNIPAYVESLGSVVNVRSGPDTTYAKISQLQPGEELMVLSASGDWYKVAIDASKTGWLANWLVQEAGAASAGGSGDASGGIETVLGIAKGTVTTDNLNVRSGPDTTYAKIGQLNTGDSINILASSEGWYQIQTGSLSGWVSVDYVTIDGTEIASVAAPAKTELTWDESGSPLGTASISWQTTSFGWQITIESSDYIGYVTQKEAKKLTIITDVTLDGELSPLDQVLVSSTLSGGSQNRLVLSWQDNVYCSFSANQEQNRITILLSTSALVGRTIVVDAGHGVINSNGIVDPGALGYTGLKEATVNLAVAEYLAVLLKNSGANVIMSRTGNTYLDLAERAYLAEASGADVFISLHCNSNVASANGTSTYFYAPVGGAYDRDARQLLANCVQNALLVAAGRANFGVRESNFAVLRNTYRPAVLVEMAFISNREEESLLATDQFRQLLAQGIFNGLQNYFVKID